MGCMGVLLSYTQSHILFKAGLYTVMKTAYRGSSPRGLAAQVLCCGAYRGLAERRFTESSWLYPRMGAIPWRAVGIFSVGAYMRRCFWACNLRSPCKPTPDPKPEIHWRSIRTRGRHLSLKISNYIVPP